MTNFNHQKRSGRARRAKTRSETGLDLPSEPDERLQALLIHREMEYLRRPTRERARKLAEIPPRGAEGRIVSLLAKSSGI
jgi:hypothetical protein